MNQPKTLRGALKSYYMLTIKSNYGEILCVEPFNDGVMFTKLDTHHRRLTRAEARHCARFLSKCGSFWFDSSGVIKNTFKAHSIQAAVLNFNPKELLS